MSVRCYGCMNLKENSPVCEHCGYDERSQNNTHQLPAGTEVGGQYILGRVLGQGGFGITYIGWDKIMNQRVAVKEYFPSGYAGRDTLRTLEVTSYDNQNAHAFEANKRRFLREAESLARLWNIPQIVKVLRHFEENGTAYIAMEYAEGMDLRKYMKRRGKPLSMEELMEILGPVIQALEFVHKADLVHRDISPDNIMVLPDGSTKLLDFGAARYVENADAEKDRNTSTQAILKHGFAPPEQYRSHGALGPWTDVYAMCATVYFCLTGRIPTEAMARVMEDLEVGWDKVPGLTEQQRSALDQGMALKPKVRIQSAGELYQKLFGEILEAREKARREEAEKQRRLEEARRREEERKAEEARRAEEAHLKEESRKAEQQRRKEAAAEKERLYREAQQRRLEEKQKKQQSRKQKKGKPWIWIGAIAAAAVVVLGIFLVRIKAPASDVQLHKPTETQQETAAAETDPTENTVAQTTAPEVTAERWRENVLMVMELEYESDALIQWWENNQSRYTGHYTSSIRLEKNGEYIYVPMPAYIEYLGGLPFFNTGIARSSVKEVIFLDSTADAPQDAWDVSYDQDGRVLAWVIPTGEGSNTLYIAGDGGVNGIQSCNSLFYGFNGLDRICFNGCFHMEEVTDMSYMFAYCSNLKTVDMETLDTSSMTDMSGIFSFCESLEELDLRNLDTSSVTSMASVFSHCTSLKSLDLSTWDTSHVKDMGWMFIDCSSLTQVDLSGFDTSNVTNMHMMFHQCTGLQKLDLSSFRTPLVEKMTYMFYGCTSLEWLDISGFTTESLQDSESMFGGCHRLPESCRLKVGS